MTYIMGNKRKINIPDNELDAIQRGLGVSKAEAVSIWLCDNDYDTDEAQEELDAKAKKVKIDHGAGGKKRGNVQRERKENPDKQEIIKCVGNALLNLVGEIDLRNPEKYIDFRFNGVEYTLNLVAHRPPKK